MQLGYFFLLSKKTNQIIEPMFNFESIIFLKILIVFFTFSILGASIGFSQNSISDSKIEKYRYTKYSSENGTSFPLALTSASSSTTIYQLSTLKLKEPHINKNIRLITSSVNLNALITENSSQLVNSNEIAIYTGQKEKFKARCKTPKRR